MNSPSYSPVLIGHDAALRQVREAYASGRMHHAWLVTGPEGIGKATMAFHMAHYVLSGGANLPGRLNMQHPAARLVAAESHPDLFILRRAVDEKTGAQKDSIAVEDARKLASFLRMTATHGGWRVAIIDEAQALNRFGQNAILKAIEEPPARCLIILTVTTPGALLPTIRSRCRVLPLQTLEDDVLRAVLERCGADAGGEAEWQEILALSGGSAGFALKVLQTESLPLYKDLLALLKDLPALDMVRLHQLADKTGRKADADSFAVLTRLLTERLRRAVKAQAEGKEPLEAEEASFDARLASGGRLDRTLQLWDKVGQIFAVADHANLDHKLAFINAIAEIRRAAA
jgi:DNA polymerase-3 subunit delta'